MASPAYSYGGSLQLTLHHSVVHVVQIENSCNEQVCAEYAAILNIPFASQHCVYSECHSSLYKRATTLNINGDVVFVAAVFRFYGK